MAAISQEAQEHKRAYDRRHQRAWAKANPEARRAIEARYRARHREKVNARSAAWRKARRAKERLAMATRPRPEHCEVCGAGEGAKKRIMHFDHDHTTGRFRGWLCARCNITLGQVNDDPILLDKLALYLLNFIEEQGHAH